MQEDNQMKIYVTRYPLNKPAYVIILITQATNEGSGKPAHLRSLTRAFAVLTHKVWKYTKGPIRHLAPLDGCACAFEERVYVGRKVP